MTARETPVVDLRRLATIVGALVALIGGTLLLISYSRSAAWWLVEPAHSQDLDARLVAASTAEDEKPPHPATALKSDVAQIVETLRQTNAALVAQSAAMAQTTLMAGAGLCGQVGGTPHEATLTCILVEDGEVTLVPLNDATALLGRFKLKAAVARKVAAVLREPR